MESNLRAFHQCEDKKMSLDKHRDLIQKWRQTELPNFMVIEHKSRPLMYTLIYKYGRFLYSKLASIDMQAYLSMSKLERERKTVLRNETLLQSTPGHFESIVDVEGFNFWKGRLFLKTILNTQQQFETYYPYIIRKIHLIHVKTPVKYIYDTFVQPRLPPHLEINTYVDWDQFNQTRLRKIPSPDSNEGSWRILHV